MTAARGDLVLPEGVMAEPLMAPFPYWGGKSSVASIVWERLGDVVNFVEPFFGSGAVLLARPADHDGKIETVNDLDGMIANFWRAVAADPDAVAHYADWPVNENDLTARHIWLVHRKDELQTRLEGDPDFYDARIAGYWCWGMCCWIGSGFCSGEGPWTSVDGQLVHLGDAGQGVNRKRVLITNDGVGVTRNSGGIYDWMQRLSDRLRRVRVCCGDWSRVCGPTPTIKQGLTGVFLDPPYGEGRTADLYRVDSLRVAEDVRRWAIEWGEHPLMRICVAGYEAPGYDFPPSWECVRWKARGGYGSQGDGDARENSRRERLWFSPGCIKPGGPRQEVLDL